MPDYIEREAATTIPPLPKELRSYQTFNLDDAFDDGWYGAQWCIANLPAADVRPVVRASWEEKEKDGVWWYACSVCGEHIPKGRWGQEWHSNFCPNCGADMRMTND